MRLRSILALLLVLSVPTLIILTLTLQDLNRINTLKVRADKSSYFRSPGDIQSSFKIRRNLFKVKRGQSRTDIVEALKLHFEPFTPSVSAILSFCSFEICERAEEGVTQFFWQLWLYRHGGDLSPKAGIYEIEPSKSLHEILLKMHNGDVAVSTITLIEGERIETYWRQICTHPAFLPCKNQFPPKDMALNLAFKNASTLEGLPYPDTYQIQFETNPREFLQRTIDVMQRHINQQWQGRNIKTTKLIKSPYELLIMASLIEKETGLGHERERVAGVFYNRLRARMPLQTDPTVIYARGGDFSRPIYKRDLKIKSPFNTYYVKGLTPTPIASPSLASLKAACHPEKHDYYYFVATGEGGHMFSKSLKAHNRAVKAYRKRIKAR